MITVEQKNILENLIANKNACVVKNCFHNILEIQHFENLLNLSPFASGKRLLTTWSTPAYTWPNPDWSTGTDHWPVSLVEKFLDEGICYIRNCSRVNKYVNNICSVIEDNTNTPVDAHLYFSKSEESKKSFGVHKDDAHNIIVQVQGESHWTVGSKIYNDMDRNLQNFPKDDVITIDEILSPGDILFVPSQVYHKARSLSKRISISFPIPTDKGIGNFEEREWINWNA